MLEMEDALAAWSIPTQCPSGTSFVCSATKLPAHRKIYLEYEGEVSGNRGSVRRIDTGTYRQISEETVILYGTHFIGTLTFGQETLCYTRAENGRCFDVADSDG